MNTPKVGRTKLHKAIRFFQEHAGYCTPPGKMVCAKHLAIAERAAELSGAVYEWEYEQSFLAPEDLTDDAKLIEKWRENPPEVMNCILRDGNGVVRASLGGIIDADANYRRVIEAELALEAFGQEYFIN